MIWFQQILGTAALLAAFVVGSGSALAQASQTVRVRGTVMSLDSTALVVKSRDGQDLQIRLAESWGVSGVVKAEIDAIKPGTFVGIAAVPGTGGSLRAIEVLVFPETMRGSGEGHYAWDLLPESSMTNATVTSTVQGVEGRTLTLAYKDGEKTIIVPAGAPIVTFASAEKADVKAGAAVFVPTQRLPDGTHQDPARRLLGHGRLQTAASVTSRPSPFAAAR